MAKWLLGAIPTIAQISIVLAVIAFFQQQEPSIETRISHQTKLLTLQNTGLTPVNVNAYVILFNINRVTLDGQLTSINKDDPIGGLHTRGPIIRSETIWPFSSFNRDLTNYGQLEFDEWSGQDLDWATYCIAIKSRTWLGSKSSTQIVLTPKLKFSASLIGPMPMESALGGGYPKTLFALEKQLSEVCLSIFEKVR